MSDDISNSNLRPWIDPGLEARIVALVLGEASDFEREELERRMSEDSDLAAYRQRIESVHGLLGEFAPGQKKGSAELSPAVREGLLAAFESKAESDRSDLSVPSTTNAPAKHSQRMRRLLAIAAVVIGFAFIASLTMPAYNRVSSKSALYSYGSDASDDRPPPQIIYDVSEDEAAADADDGWGTTTQSATVANSSTADPGPDSSERARLALAALSDSQTDLLNSRELNESTAGPDIERDAFSIAAGETTSVDVSGAFSMTGHGGVSVEQPEGGAGVSNFDAKLQFGVERDVQLQLQSPQFYGNFDNGMGGTIDGAFINKTDEGNTQSLARRQVAPEESLAQNTKMDLEGDPAHAIPIFQREFLGGANDLRGFRYQDVGPKPTEPSPARVNIVVQAGTDIVLSPQSTEVTIGHATPTTSSLDIADRDFLSGGDVPFTGKASAEVMTSSNGAALPSLARNVRTQPPLPTIAPQASEPNLKELDSMALGTNGYAEEDNNFSGGSVVQLGDFIDNQGSIGAVDGTIALGAGGDILVSQADAAKISIRTDEDITNTGEIRANNADGSGGFIMADAENARETGTLRIDGTGAGKNLGNTPGGSVTLLGESISLGRNADLSADSGVGGATTSGSAEGTITILATGGSGDGGTINITGDTVTLSAGTPTIDADGATGGGNIAIGGSFQGRMPSVDAKSNSLVEIGSLEGIEGETSKTNINTHAGGTAWDTPRAGGDIDRNLGRFEPAQHEWQNHPETAIADGEVSSFGRIDISGNIKTADKVIRREVLPQPVGANPITAGNRSGGFAVTDDSIDGLIAAAAATPADDLSRAQEIFGVAGVKTDSQYGIVKQKLDEVPSSNLWFETPSQASATAPAADRFADSDREEMKDIFDLVPYIVGGGRAYANASPPSYATLSDFISGVPFIPGYATGVVREGTIFSSPTQLTGGTSREVQIGHLGYFQNDDTTLGSITVAAGANVELSPGGGWNGHTADFASQPGAIRDYYHTAGTFVNGYELYGTEHLIDALPPVMQSAVLSKTRKLVNPAGLDETATAEEPFSTFSLHVSDVSFLLAQTALAKGEWPDAERIRVEEFVNAFDYGDPLPSLADKVACQMEQSIHPFLQQRNLLRLSMRTAAAGRSQATPLHLTLVLDHSGSMERHDRRQTVQRAFEQLADQLTANDTVNVIGFARQPRLLIDRASGDARDRLLATVSGTPSEGGTHLESALDLAFEKARELAQAGESGNAQNRIILLTDGAANLGDADPARLAQKVEAMREAGIAFDAAGIGADGLNDEILEALTRKGDGRYYLLDRPEDADEGFARQIAGALRPAAMNVKVQIEFNPERVASYKLLGFEKHRLNKEDFRNDSVDAAEIAAEEAGVAVYQFEPMADGKGDVGTAFLRFRDMSSGQMVEKRWPIAYAPDAPRPDQASPKIRLATVAALFAAKLKGDALGETVQLQELSQLLDTLPEHLLNLDRVQLLRTMIEQARNL